MRLGNKQHFLCSFVCFKVHPNAERSPHLRLKMYEFAGRVVGKCLYESALGGAYKQLVRARFTRSFLAQIIGLRMNYKVRKGDRRRFVASSTEKVKLRGPVFPAFPHAVLRDGRPGVLQNESVLHSEQRRERNGPGVCRGEVQQVGAAGEGEALKKSLSVETVQLFQIRSTLLLRY